MISLDSWIWIEFFSEDKRWKKAQDVIRKLEEGNEIGVIITLVLTEVRYQIKRKFDQEKADRLIHTMESFKNLRILPVTAEVLNWGQICGINTTKERVDKFPTLMLSIWQLQSWRAVKCFTQVIQTLKILRKSIPKSSNILALRLFR